MNNIKCIIVDDEPLAIEILEEYVQKVGGVESVGSFDSGIEALNFIKKNAVDLVLLDIQMPDLTGLQMAELIRGESNVIFTTAYAEHAIEGFELEAKDYLLKPISFERFYKSMERFQKSNNPGSGKSDQDYIFVKSEYKLQKIRFEDIHFIEGMKDYLRIVTNDSKVMTLQSFTKMEKNLPADRFMRVHKSYMVAIDKIDSVEKGKIRIGEELIPVGEAYKDGFYKSVRSREI